MAFLERHVLNVGWSQITLHGKPSAENQIRSHKDRSSILMRHFFPPNSEAANTWRSFFVLMRGDARLHRYVSINFGKDLRAHIAAKRRDDFGGTPPLATNFRNALAALI
jgi:hypothetical protein